MRKTLCPVCGDDSGKRLRSRSILLEELLQSGQVAALKPGVLAYRCGKGHFFLMDPKPKQSTKRRSTKRR